MHVIVVGAGEVGTNIAESLASSHDVTVIDIDPDRVDELKYSIDVLTIQGEGTSLATLEEAGIEDADLLIACTNNDETNIVICGVAKVLGNAFTIARVKQAHYLETWRQMEGAFDVDFMVCSDLETAMTIVNLVGLPAAHDVDSFAGGVVQMAEFHVPSASSIAGQTVREADRFDSLTFVAVVRNGDVEIARGDTVLQGDDYLVVIGSPDSIHQFAIEIHPEQMPDPREVVIFGGSEIGFQCAQLLEERNLKPRLVEVDHDRARELAERLPNTVVLESDATDVDFLTREHVDEADVVIATLPRDELNLFVALLAEGIGAKRTVAVVETGEYVDLFEAVGVDVAVNPRSITAEEVIRFTRGTPTENISLLHNDLAEVLEIEVDSESVLIDRTIKESMADLPQGVVIGAITRNGSLITPRGDTVVRDGDHIIIFVETEELDSVSAYL